MASAERFVRHHKQQTDRAISQAYQRLATNSLALATFEELLYSTRRRAGRMLDAPVVDGLHPGVEALVNLARFSRTHIRRIADWPGSSASWRQGIAALAGHMICQYSVPRFLSASWYATDEALAERKRQWFVRHALGASFRSLDLPIEMTSKMEHIFLTSQDHLGIEQAMRGAELRALGAPDHTVRAVLTTSVATDLRHGAFWRTVWTFLVANAGAIEPAQIGPMIDFIQSIRHEHVAIDTPEGMVMREPPHPSFSMKGRTVPSMLRLVRDWHRSLGVANGGLTWERSQVRPMLIEEPGQDPSAPPVEWQLTELTNGAQLRAEGAALRHCVSSYAERCWRGRSRIWSMRVRRGNRVKHVLTIEVDPMRRAVVQARGWGNRTARGKPLRLLQDWTVRERLLLTLKY